MASVKQTLRQDFMEGGGKGGSKDPLTRQVPMRRKRLTQQQLSDLYAANRIVQNIIDIPAEDATREWIELKIDNEKIKTELEAKLRDLKAREAFQKMLKYEALRGDGFVSIGTTESRNFELSDPLIPEQVRTVDYLHAFSSIKMSSISVNDDPFSPNYGEVEFYTLKNRLASKVHRSRILHLQTRKLEEGAYPNDEWGQSLLEPMYDILTVFDTAVWSVGQILYDYTFKVLKTTDVETMSKQEKQEAQMLLDFMFRTEALAIIAPDEEVNRSTVQLGPIEQLLNFIWEVLAGSARMPKAHILGQQQGTITGGQYDTLNYYARIAGVQEIFIRPKLEYLINILLAASGEIGGNILKGTEWELKFKPLWRLDKATDAEIREKISNVDSRYIQWGVLQPDEVREARFGKFGLAGELGYTEDEADELDKYIKDKQRKELD